MNLVTLIGNVGRDPEIRYTQAGDAIANFSLATSERWKNKQGEKQEETEWHRVTVFHPASKVIKDHVSKGDRLAIIGKVHYSEWDDNDGNKRYSTEIQVGFGGRVELLGSPGGRKQEPAAAEEDKPFQATDDDVPF